MNSMFQRVNEFLLATGFLCAVCLMSVQAQEKSREIYVPFKDLKSVLAGPIERIYLPRSEYESLLKKADIKPGTAPPQKSVLRKARYDLLLHEDFASIKASLEVESLEQGLQLLPLKFVGVSVLKVTLDGEDAPVVRTNPQTISLLLKRPGKFAVTMELATPVRNAAAEQSLSLELPHAANESIGMRVPGNIEIKSGASVVERQVDDEANVTEFELLPMPGPMVVTMSLNNKRLRTERQIIARSVVVDELNTSFERLHATYSMEIIQGATTELQYEIPPGFQVTNVDAADLARWSVQDAEQVQNLTVEFRSPQTKLVTVQITAIQTSPIWGDWTFPTLKALGVETSTAVVGILAERRLAVGSLVVQGAIPLNNAVLENSLPQSIFVVEPGAPPLQILSTYYVPQQEFKVAAKVLQPESQLNVQTNTVLTLSRDRHQAAIDFFLYPALDDLFGFDVQTPDGWNVKAIVDENQSQLKYHETIDAEGTRRLHVKFPNRRPFGQLHRVTLVAERVPAGWLSEWEEYTLETPAFVVEDTYRNSGVIGIRTIEPYQDVFEIRADMVDGAFPLSASDRTRAALANPVTLAYQYDTTEYAISATVRRVPALFASRLASFFDVQQGVHKSYHEIAINIQRSQLEEVTFTLPANSTPANIAITGQAGTQVKQFNSHVQGEQRFWKVLLSTQAFSEVTLGVEYQQQVDEREARLNPAFPKVLGSGYQSGVFSVEASPELEVNVSETNGKQVDVGELAVNGYVVGKHRVAAYRYTGDSPTLDVSIRYPDLRPIPAVLINKAEMLTYVAARGIYQTVAKYSLLTKADYVRVVLPHENAVLWGVVVDGNVTVKPQVLDETTRGDFLVDLSTAGTDGNNIRDLRIIYEEQQEPSGDFRLKAPQLLEHGRNVDSSNAPLVEPARVKWQMMLPASYRLNMRNTDVMKLTNTPVQEVPQAVYLSGALYLATGGLPPIELSDSADYQMADSMGMEEGAIFPDHPPLPTDDSVFNESDMDFADRPFSDDEAVVPESLEPSEAMPKATAPEMAMKKKELSELSESRAQAEAAASGVLAGAEADSPSESRAGEMDFEEVKTNPSVQEAGNDESAGEIEEGQRRGQRDSGLQWALEGRNSLDIDLLARVENSRSFRVSSDYLLYEFGNLGGQAAVEGRVVRKSAGVVLSWVVGLLVLAIGVLIGHKETKIKRRFLVFILLFSAVISGIPQLEPYRGVAEMMFASAILLVIGYMIYRMLHPGLGWFCTSVCRKLGVGVLLPFIIATADTATAQQVDGVVSVEVPKDAVVVPYDPDNLPLQKSDDQQLLIPLQRYTELFKRAYPGLPLEHEYLPVKYALGGVEYATSLYEDNSLLIEGRVGIDIFSDRPQAIGLSLGDLVIEYATLDDQPAQMKVGAGDRLAPNVPAQQQLPAVPPAAMTHQLFVSGKGHHMLRIGLRMPVARQGGWRVASGRLPIGASGLMKLTVPETNTELRWNNHLGRSEYRTSKPNEGVESSLRVNGSFDFRWRPVIQESLTDRDLTSQSELIVDVQEDGVYADWFVNLNFRNSSRDLFRLRVPKGIRVESVKGANIRSWEVVNGAAGNQDISVEMLEPAQNVAQLRVSLVRYRALPADEIDQFEVPLVSVPDAVSQKGAILVRRSPMLDITIDEVQGLSRLDVNEFPGLNRVNSEPANTNNVQVISRESPLGIRPLFAYQFTGGTYGLTLGAMETKSRASANLKTLVRVSPQEITLESMIRISDGSRPIHQVQLVVPKDLVIRQLSAPGLVEWAEDRYESVIGEAKLVTVLLGQGLKKGFNVILEGKLDRKLENWTTSVPYLAVRGVQSQNGETVLSSDPSFDIELLDVRQGESVAMASMFGWLKSNQRLLARTALKFVGPDYSAKFQLVPRNASVNCRTFTNVHVTDRAVEETILLEYKVSNAGQRDFNFRLPKYMKGRSVISAQYLQRVVWEDEAEDSEYVTVKLLLEDEVLNEYRVLVQMDRQAGGDARAPVPIILGDNVAVLAQFVSLESSGDQISEDPDTLRGLEKLNRQSAPWRDLTAVLGNRIREAFLVTTQNPAFAEIRYSVKSNQVVNRDAAKIRLSTTYLAVDYAGTYRAKLELLIDNQTEQFLEIRLPSGARLWAVSAAGDPVKPIKGKAKQDLKIPLVKTEDGELSYLVQVHYAGDLGKELTQFGELASLPIIKDMNIVADGSTFVKLYLPKDRRWFGFGGEGELIARTDQRIGSVLKFKQSLVINQEIDEKLRRANQSSNPYEKIRLFNSLNTETDVNNYATQGDVQTRNGQQIEELNKQIDQLVVQGQDASKEAELLFDNRKQLNQRFLEQMNDISNNAVNQLGNNFDVPVDNATKEDELNAAESQFRKGWFEGNGLIREQSSEADKLDANRLYKGNTQNFQAPGKQTPESKATLPQPYGGKQRDSVESGQERLQQQLRQYQMQQKESLENRKPLSDNFDSQRNASVDEKIESSEQEKPSSGGMGGGGAMGGFGANGNTENSMDADVNDRLQPYASSEQRGEMLVADSTGFASVAGFVFDETSLNDEYEQFEIEYISAASEFTFSAKYVGHSLIETLIRVGVVIGTILTLMVGGLIIKVGSRSKWLVGFLAVCFLPISLFMILRWVFPVLGLAILVASVTWLLKKKFTSKTLRTA